MPVIENFRYRAEIDGLRAIAVLAVVLFHAGFGCPGGYVGVDVFFVISGFLITALIWKDMESGKFTFATFWERRARRIAPALVVVTLAVLVAGYFLLLPADLSSLGRATASQAVFAANIHYWLDTNYFAAAADEKPLLHTWSLAVEEQFYLFVPFLLYGMFRIKALRTRATVLTVFSVGAILSFLLSVYAVKHYSWAAFYLLPSRAWELLLGSIVAFLPAQPAVLKHRMVREAVALTGFGLILIPMFVYTAKTDFPGIAALPPCLGAALLIWGNGRRDGSDNMPTVVGRLISLPPVVFVGLISYSLYLWHWPFLAFSKYLVLSPYAQLPLMYRLIPVVLGCLFAVLSWKYVETPFRTRAWGTTQKSMLVLAGTGITCLLFLGLVCIATKGLPQRLSPQALKSANAKSDDLHFYQLTNQDIIDGKLIPLGVQDPSLSPTVFVWGDSHAYAALPAIDDFLQEKHLVGQAATHSATPPLLDLYADAKTIFGLRRDSLSYNDLILSYIQSHHIPEVILICRWGSYKEVKNKEGEKANLDSALLATIRRIVAIGSRPWILLDVPNQTFDVPKALSLKIYSDDYITSLCVKPTRVNELQQYDPEIVSKIEAAGGRVLDPKPRFLDPTGQYYMIKSNDTVLYRDTDHLTISGAKTILLPLFRDSMNIR